MSENFIYALMAIWAVVWVIDVLRTERRRKDFLLKYELERKEAEAAVQKALTTLEPPAKEPTPVEVKNRYELLE